MYVFHYLSCEDLFGTVVTTSTLEDSCRRMYSIEKLTQLTDRNKVVEVAAPNIDGLL
jgi:hypothetical protein